MSSTVRTAPQIALGAAVGTTAVILAMVLLGRSESDSDAPDPVGLVSDDAARSCGVEIPAGVEEPEDRPVAVPAPEHGTIFMPVPAARTPAQILCGDGATYGAVHIETEHGVPNWGEAITAMTNAIERGQVEPVEGGTRHVWEFVPGRSLTVLVGEETVLTAFPSDGQGSSWSEASVA